MAVDEVRDSVRTHDARYLDRIYTEREVSDCRSAAGVDATRLAARFAAKEAALKVLRPDGHAIPWRSIEVRRDPRGWVDIELSGAAAARASEVGVSDLAVSLTHEGAYASAVVIADLHATSR